MNTETISTTNNDLLDQYRNISNKLKKRFLRKPNVTEACDSYTALAQYCERTDLPAYAGLCWIAAARCDGSLTNITGEIACLLRAARQFIRAELDDYRLNCPSPSKENLEAALSYFRHAISKHPDSCIIPVAIYLEIIDTLKKLNKPEFIEHHLRKMLEFLDDGSDLKLYCEELLGWNLIENSNYLDALDVFWKITNILRNLDKNGARLEQWKRCEIIKIFLVLILQPNGQKLPKTIMDVLDQSSLESFKTIVGNKLYILLGSLMRICRDGDDYDNLVELENQFWPLLDSNQKDLLRHLVCLYMD